MKRKSSNAGMTSALVELLENYVAGRISDRRWERIMEVLDSGVLNPQERLEYAASLNQTTTYARLSGRS